MKTVNAINSVSEIQELEKMGVEIEFTPENEDISPFGQFDDDETAQKICDKYERGNEAAWFCAKVSVRFRGFEGTNYLGCCSYKSFKEFCSDESGYYVDMVNQCISQVNTEIQARNYETQKAWDIRRAVNLIQSYGYEIFQSIRKTA
jgi:hypothetical protein